MVMGNLEDGIGDGTFDECWLLKGLSSHPGMLRGMEGSERSKGFG